MEGVIITFWIFAKSETFNLLFVIFEARKLNFDTPQRVETSIFKDEHFKPFTEVDNLICKFLLEISGKIQDLYYDPFRFIFDILDALKWSIKDLKDKKYRNLIEHYYWVPFCEAMSM